MTEDEHGIRIKPGQTGHRGPPLGPRVWLVVRHDDTMWGPFESRHEAVGFIATRFGPGNVNDFRPVSIRVGSFRFDDVRQPYNP